MAAARDIRNISRFSNAPVLVTVVLLSFAVVIMAATILILASLNEMATHANDLDARRVKETAGGGLVSIDQQMASTVSDYTAWDDAVRAVYVENNHDWLVANYGTYTGNSELFDTYYMISADDRTIMAYKSGVERTAGYRSYFGPSIDALLAKLKTGTKDNIFQTTGFIETQDGPAVVGIGYVRTNANSLTVPLEKATRVIIARHLSAKLIDQMAHNYLISDLKLVPGHVASERAIGINDAEGKTIASLEWSLSEPGSTSYHEVRPLVVAGLVVVGAFFAGLFVFGILLVQKLRNDERSARAQSFRDKLTGLRNRAGLSDALATMIETAKETSQDVVLVLLDLDRFKDINDAYGHAVGDQLIRGVTAALKDLMPKGSVVARIGADEFTIAFATDETLKMSHHVEHMILSFFREPLTIGGRLTPVGASLGIAISKAGSVAAEELLRRSDLAMYRSKALRSERAVFYNSAMDDDREARMVMAQDLRIALDHEALDVVYQPVISARTRQITGVEALVRWNREGFGFVSPDIFIAVSENTGLINRIGEFVMRRAFAEGVRWPELKIAVNVSPVQLSDPDFVRKTADIVKETGLHPSRAIIEITEGFFISNPERARASITEIRRIGMKVSLDDFGSGFSSVGYLRRFGFDRLKIDRSLTNALGKEDKAGELLRATAALAAAFDLPVTAEGVETAEQAEYLTACGCDELQGFLFSKPVSAREISNMLANNALPKVAAAG